MQYSAIINGVNKIWEQCGIEVNYNACMLEVTPLVLGDGCTPMNETWSDSPRDGWPIKVSVHYDEQVDLRVEILDPVTRKPFNFKGGPDDFLVTWDTEAYAENGVLEFEAEGRYGHGDYLEHPNVPYDGSKSDFFVYPVNACGKSFIIKVVDEANNIKDEALMDLWRPQRKWSGSWSPASGKFFPRPRRWPAAVTCSPSLTVRRLTTKL
jgi:hypothetical protein